MMPTRESLGTLVKDAVTETVLPWKWRSDSRSLPLSGAHSRLYEQVHRHCFRAIRRFPRLADPQDVADKINWLKLFDQDELKVTCCDKELVKRYGAAIVGEEFFPETLQLASRFSDLDLAALPDKFVLKATHDSGTVALVDKAVVHQDHVERRFTAALSTLYGWEKGEWPYSLLEPRLLAEELLVGDGASLPDYKFHCVDGRVAWLQYIYDRDTVPKESLAERNGDPLPVRFSPQLAQGQPFSKPRELELLVELAEVLSAPFRYVRVDLYLVKGRPYVGELTFFPLSGCYTGSGQRLLAQRLTFDRSVFKPPVVSDRGVRVAGTGTRPGPHP